jgi:hypothetical protein
MKHFRLFLFFNVLILGSSAQSRYPAHTAFTRSIGLQLGTPGIGIEAGMPLKDDLNIRVQANYFPEVRKHYRGLIYQPERTNVGLNVDWQPLFGENSWWARKWFISAGMYYFMKHEVNTFIESRVEGYPREQFYHAELSKVRPYVGMGLGRMAIAERLFINLNGGLFIPTKKTKVFKSNAEEYDPAYVTRVEQQEHHNYNRPWAHFLTSLNIQVGIFYDLAYRFNTYSWEPKEFMKKKEKKKTDKEKATLSR